MTIVPAGVSDSEKATLLDLLQGVIRTACDNDSMSVSAYADALRVLAEHGRCRIIKELGDRVIVEWAK